MLCIDVNCCMNEYCRNIPIVGYYFIASVNFLVIST